MPMDSLPFFIYHARTCHDQTAGYLSGPEKVIVLWCVRKRQENVVALRRFSGLSQLL